MNPNYKKINVKQQELDTESVLKFYQELIQLRNDNKYSQIIVNGIFLPYEVEEVSVIAYQRIMGSEGLLIIHNFQNQESSVKIPRGYTKKIIGNYKREFVEGELYSLRPYECIALYRRE